MTTTDESWAAELRQRLDLLVPPAEVDAERAVERARRRRAARRGGGAALVLVAVLGTAWGVASGVVTPDVPPAGVGGPTAGPSDARTPTPALTRSPDAAGGVARAVPAEAVVAEDGTVTGVPGDPWEGDAPYWYVRVELRTGEDVEEQEWWASRERPGLLLLDGVTARAIGRGPADGVGGAVVLDGVRYERVSDPRALPTDPAQLLRAVVDAVPPDPSPRAGTVPDPPALTDAVFDEVLGALHHRGGLLPRELRDAYWEAAALLPGASVGPGEDELGRVGEVLRVPAADGTENRLVRDPATGLLLESRSAHDDEVTRFLEQRTAADVPVAPSLEPLGCTSWAECVR
ncbi:hypothetical protein Cfla_2505 [Cellulomonas flavigena DSM 20109]|uniref:CU044_5270 family protein n=1 Tax=Cellulomonas flavigena (strain ATCC 482 / DSM 20109 / BCRC 11376 / JCM 18109 / NBRC 3775 / NCIMB 8073 / NRS 134) TaxID=446466 RepID=D5UI48_CELFN|nr:hypothetical protein [Cellulomonas flavigena]ADG75393.1 hypothetical protein Cfla_2505 [Cellulomonas flavigena DSM 20109]